MVYFFIVYFTYAISKRINIFKYYFFSSIIRVCCCSWVFDCYSYYNKYVSITLITYNWPCHWSSKSNLVISIIPSSCIISYFNPTFDSKFRWLIWYIARFFFFFVDILLLYYYSIVLTVRLSIILCLSSGNIYFSLDIVLSFSSVAVSELLYFDFFWNFCNFVTNEIASCFWCFSYTIIIQFKPQFISNFLSFSRDIYLSLGVSLSYSIITFSEWFCFQLFETFLTLSEILLSIKSPVASAVFWISLFEEVLMHLLHIFVAWSKRFDVQLT